MYVFFLIFYGNEYVYGIAKNLQDYRQQIITGLS